MTEREWDSQSAAGGRVVGAGMGAPAAVHLGEVTCSNLCGSGLRAHAGASRHAAPASGHSNVRTPHQALSEIPKKYLRQITV